MRAAILFSFFALAACGKLDLGGPGWPFGRPPAQPRDCGGGFGDERDLQKTVSPGRYRLKAGKGVMVLEVTDSAVTLSLDEGAGKVEYEIVNKSTYYR